MYWNIKIMRKIFALVGAVLLLASCTKDIEQRVELASGEGAMRLGVAMQSEVTDAQNIVIKVYKVEGETETLIRRYNSLDDIAEPLALLAGNYVAKVYVGDKNVVSYDAKYYYGETPFMVTAGEVEAVTVDCRLQSTIVRVEYDASVAEKLDEGYFTTVAIDDAYNADAIKIGDVYALTFEQTAEGYVIMPEGETSLYWHFEGKNESNGDIVKEGLIENVKPSTKYTIKLKYSNDAPGGLLIEATVVEDIDEFDDTISFSPDPTIIGENGCDVNSTQTSTGDDCTYRVSALATINMLNVVADGVEYDLINNTYDGITVVKNSDTEYLITIAEAFFVNVSGGLNDVTFRVKDVDGGKLDKAIVYNVQGVIPMSTADYDLWFGNVTFKANVVDTAATAVQIAYRTSGGEWTTIDAVAGTDGTYTASSTNFAAEKVYEYKLIVGGVDSGKALSHTTATGNQLPNANFEGWSSDGKVPNGDSSKFWFTGNNDFVTLTSRAEGRNGGSCAYLDSQAAVGKFAAGNLFTGDFQLNMSTFSGVVTFGRDFTYNARPKSFSAWIKNNEGTITHGDKASGTDIYTIMVLITDGTTYPVDTTNQSSFLTYESLATRPGIIAYGWLSASDSNADWTEKTIELVYRDDMKTVKPKKVVVSFTPSGYGDYFCGSTDSWMYVDDVRFNY